MAIGYRDEVDGLRPAQLTGGFFEGWRDPRTPEEHLRILQGSDLVQLAVQETDGQVVGFATVISDGLQSAFVSLLEVLPAHRGQGIGTTLMRLLLGRLEAMNEGRGINVDLSCDEDLVPFYERLGMAPGRAMWTRPRLRPARPAADRSV